MKRYFLLIAVALLVSILSCAPLSWDGSYFLFRIIDSGTPFAPFSRLSDVLLHYPVVYAMRFTDNLSFLMVLFGFFHALVPIVSLFLCWIVVRNRAPHLFLWASLGICIGTLPGQFGFTSEGIAVVQLFWPIFLWILVKMPVAQAPIIAILTPFVFFFHPASSALFAFSAVVCVIVWGLYHLDRRWATFWLVLFLMLAATRYEMIRSGYESQQLSVTTQARAFYNSLAGFPLAAIVSSLVYATLELATSVVQVRQRYRMLSTTTSYAALAACFLFFILWARNAGLWMGGISYKDLALPINLPFMGLAILEVVCQARGLGQEPGRAFHNRLPFIWATAVIFSSTLYFQNRVFAGSTDQLRLAMAQSASPCLSMNSLPNLYRTALNNWALPAYATLIQGKNTNVLVLPGDDCVRARLDGHTQLIPFDSQSSGQGWFSLYPARAQLQQAVPCWYTLYPNWYPLEATGADWLRWSANSGAVRIFLSRPATAQITGQLAIAQKSGQIVISANGVSLATVAVTNNFQPFAPLSVALQRGENTLQFHSLSSAIRIGPGSRLLSLAARDIGVSLLEATSATLGSPTTTRCAWQS